MKFIITALVLTFSIMGMFCGCQKKEESKTMHFGPSPDDGDTENVEESFHFGPSPGDGVID